MFTDQIEEQECERPVVAVVSGPGHPHGPNVPGSGEVCDSCWLRKTVTKCGEVRGEVRVSSQAGVHPETLPLQSELVDGLIDVLLATSTFIVV